MIDIKVPPLGESITEATVTRWTKSEGELVAAGETVVELETDKINVEVPAQRGGVLAKLLKQEGETAGVGDVLGQLDETATAAAPRPTTPSAARPPSDTAPTVESAPPARPSAAMTPPPKAAPAPAAPPRPAAAPLSVAPPRPLETAPAHASEPRIEQPTEQQPTDQQPAEPRTEPRMEQRVAPSAQRYADERGLSLAGVTGTGRGGVVSKPDVLEQRGAERSEAASAESQTQVAPPPPAPQPSAREAPSPPATPRPVPPEPSGEIPRPPETAENAVSGSEPAARHDGADAARETREKMSTRRRRIAENLLQSHRNTAHLTTFNEIDMSAVIAVRERHKERIEKEHGLRLSFMPFFAKASVVALKAFPVVNAQIDGDSIIYKHYINLGIAVASEQGLVVPNIKDAHQRGLIDIGHDIVALAKRARDQKLTMDDLTGGTFTITNGGVFGSLISTPIINFPQVAILGLHKIQDRPMVVDGRIEARPMMYVALSYDHRIIDGQQAVLFLVRIKELMEDPAAMLLD
jgi:2-oxoglutarate dehydrogenase E2 component (dihydrolipoamide succinyltransferase)